HLAGLEPVFQVRTVKPETFHAGAALPGSHLEYRHAAGAEKTGGSHRGNDSCHFSGTKFGNTSWVQAVLITERLVAQQVVYCVYALACQDLRDARADPLHVLHGRVEIEHLQGC